MAVEREPRQPVFSHRHLHANGVTPVEYLADVLVRLQARLASWIDTVLPHYWTPPKPEPSA